MMGIHKVNTTAYNPQTDGLVERFNRILIDMIARLWRKRLGYPPAISTVHIQSHPSEAHGSTGESPFVLLYGRDCQLPTEAALNPPMERDLIALDDYKSLVVVRMTEAWQLAKDKIKTAQKRLKNQYDKCARPARFKPGDRVFVYMPAARSGKAYKLARPHHGPYCVVTCSDNTVEVRPVDQSKANSIHVALDCVRVCSEEIPDVFCACGLWHLCKQCGFARPIFDLRILPFFS